MVTNDAEYIHNFQHIPEATVAQSTLFANPVWGTEAEFASTTTFPPGVYLHNKDAAYSYLGPRDTTGLTDWAKGVTNNYDAGDVTAMDGVAHHKSHCLPIASPTEMGHQQAPWPADAADRPGASSSSSSSSASSSYIMTGETTTATPATLTMTTAILPPSIPGRARPAASATSGPMGSSSRVSKYRSKPVGGSARPSRHNSDHSPYSQSQLDDQPRSFSSASSSASPPVDEAPRRQRPVPARLSTGGGSIVGGLLTTGHGGNHNVTLRTASRKPKANSTMTIKTPTTAITAAGTASASELAPSGSGSGSGLVPAAGIAAAAVAEAAAPTTESPNSDASMGQLSPSSPDGTGQGENLTSEERRARQNHNIVEKQYRNRLNMQFNRLLSILPANQVDGPDAVGRPVEFDDRRMSKAEVLELARRRIHDLEMEIQELYIESDNLRNNVQTLNMALHNGQ